LKSKFHIKTTTNPLRRWYSRASSYSTKGPNPHTPVSLLRSYLLFLMVNPCIGITKWVDTFHGFFTRMWGNSSPNTKPHILPKKLAGDGTPVETFRYPRSKSTYDCFKNGITLVQNIT
jgi:hypothetical protein